MTIAEKMQALIDTMPCLKAKGLRWQLGETNRGCLDFIDQCKGMSHGERIAASFILHVWHWDEPVMEKWAFNFGEAMNYLDPGEILAIRNWMARPWYA